MPPTVEDRLQDILEAITEIEAMLAGSSLELSPVTKYAAWQPSDTSKWFARQREGFLMRSNGMRPISNGRK
jgi:hypothetical protein